MHVSRRTLLAATGLAPVAVHTASLPAEAGRPSRPGRPPAPSAPLTNLAHLDWLTTTVKLMPSAEHTTYQLDEKPEVGMLWVYADRNADGTYRHTGGGAYDAATNTWGQGAYDVDDIARAAIVYIRHWQLFGDRHSRDLAVEMLRATAYFQTLTGPWAGQFILWMQPDGTLTPSPTPADNPNPADHGDSYWTARCVWALGEGYAAFKKSDPAFARFLAERMELSLKALQRDLLDEHYGHWKDLHGVQVPGWLVTDGADATSEALLGLAAYVRTSGSTRARRVLRQFAEGVAAFHAGSVRQWPFRALLPWAGALDNWHAWGSEMAQGLAAASEALGDRSLLQPAVGDTAGFTAQLLTSTGPDNGMLPLPVEKVQIAYGADARVRACAEVGRVTGRDGIRDLAGIAAGWFFGANRSGQPTYEPATGVTYDGVEADGRLNRNSGAESTIHGLLTMLELDADPRLKALALASGTIELRNGLTVLEAEGAVRSGGAVAKAPAAAWTGESLWSGQQVEAPAGATLVWQLPRLGEKLLVQPVVELLPDSSARTTFVADRTLGTVVHSAVGAQGDAEAPGRLRQVALPHDAADGARVTATVSGGTARLDALAVMPEVATLRASGAGQVVLLTSKSASAEVRVVEVSGAGAASCHDRNGRLVRRVRGTGRVRVTIPSGGFAVVTAGL